MSFTHKHYDRLAYLLSDRRYYGGYGVDDVADIIDIARRALPLISRPPEPPKQQELDICLEEDE